jgi:hypothetical protein
MLPIVRRVFRPRLDQCFSCCLLAPHAARKRQIRSTALASTRGSLSDAAADGIEIQYRTGSEGTQRSNWTPKYLLRCRYIRICVQYLHRQQSAIAQPLNGYCSINQMAKTQRYLRAIASAQYLLPGRTKRPENCWTCCLRMTAEHPRSRRVYKNCN